MYVFVSYSVKTKNHFSAHKKAAVTWNLEGKGNIHHPKKGL